ncbi:hypothetical protein [Flavobacterium sp. JAS]|uniref:hypothetical protein n=1 Tax=Flavobacterium sp. JAS TaxID=2897329 RepID=UPI001E635285|nr:hypothetical protein [Flavobacterium sp. JAS]MCD0468724.1 hypothetical protein [Flavobacterium sp. JAS]
MENIKQLNHKSPPLIIMAIAFTIQFIAGLSFVISFSPKIPHFPAPWETAEIITAYFRGYPHAVQMCAFFQFIAAVPLGLYVVSVVSRLLFHGVKTTGPYIALLGGLIATANIFLSSLILWVMAYPDIAQDASIIRVLYYLTYAIGGVGYSLPLGIFFAGVSITALFTKLLPKWLVYWGLALALCGLLSSLSLLSMKLLFFIPLTRFIGFIWLIIVGFKLTSKQIIE